MKLVALGSGNVASHLIPALYACQINIECVYSQTIANAKNLAKLVNAKYCDSLSEIPNDADIYLLMLPDAAISNCISLWPFELKKSQCILHTSGSFNTDSLSLISNHYGAFYPLQSFKKGKELDLSKTPFLLHASHDDVYLKMKALAYLISEHLFKITDQERKKIHLAAVILNNFTTSLFIAAESYLKKEDIPKEPLALIIENTFNNLLNEQSASTLITGPAFRNEEKTIEDHLSLLKDYPTIIPIYQSITQFIQSYFNENNT